jgi:hypothetical protein
MAFWSQENFGSLPTSTFLLFLSSKLDPTIQQAALSKAGALRTTFLQIAHCFWALLAASLGGVLARALFAVRDSHHEQSIRETRRGSKLPSKWHCAPAVIWLLGLALIGSTALAAVWSAPGLRAGVIFLLTCAMLGLAILGAAVGRGSRRTMCLGAALFGSAYMFFTFGRSADAGWPYPPTTHLLNALRPGPAPHWSGFPDASERFNVLNRSILKALDQPIPMHFPDGAPLEDILKYIRAETKARVGKPIPIYVDPVGLQSAKQTMASMVRVDLEGAALKNSLRRCLTQLDLSFAVRDGFLMITESGAALPVFEDPFLIVGHCLLALIAAGVGGVLAPLVSDSHSRTSVEDVG